MAPLPGTFVKTVRVAASSLKCRYSLPHLRRRKSADPNSGSGLKTGAAVVNRQSQTVRQRQPKGVGRRT